MKKLLLGALLISNFAYADLLVMGETTSQKSGVDISSTATANVDGNAIPLTVVGSGLRKKKTIIGTVDVYVAQLMVGDQATYTKSEADALATAGAQKAAAIRLSFVRDVPGSTVAESFLDAFDANGIDTNDADIKKFTNIVSNSGGAAKNGSLNIVFTKNADGTETVNYSNVNGSKATDGVATGAAGFSAKILAIWLGVPADDQLKDLKAELLQ
jgi:hypothetical protein